MKTLLLALSLLAFTACAGGPTGDATTDRSGSQALTPAEVPDAWALQLATLETDVAVMPPGGCTASLDGTRVDVADLATAAPVLTQWWEVPCDAVEDLGDSWGMICDAAPSEAGPDAIATLTFVIDKVTGEGTITHLRRGTWVGGGGVTFPVDCAVIYTATLAH